MKIAYIVEVDPLVHSGIIKKINNQIACWKSEGHTVKTLILWPQATTSQKTKFIEGDYFSNSVLDSLPQNFLITYLTKINGIKAVGKALDRFDPDLVYTRQNIWFPGLEAVLSRFKTVLEVNSVDYMEMEFYSALKKKVYLFGKNRILKSVAGLVAVSPDILKHYKTLEIPQKVVSNGIKLSNFSPKSLKIDDNRVSLVFVGSSNMSWHGLDKIIELATKLPQYLFKVVGYAKEDLTVEPPENMVFYGWVKSDDLLKIYAESNLGIGSFSNHLVGKNTDSTLKVLEYLANGLPVILGHRDTDFSTADFMLKITTEAHDFIPIEAIEAFIEKNKNRRVEHSEIQKIDSKNKERERLEFFKEIVGGR